MPAKKSKPASKKTEIESGTPAFTDGLRDSVAGSPASSNLPISLGKMPIAKPAQDDQFNRFIAEISFNRGGYPFGDGHNMLALFQLPQNVPQSVCVCTSMAKGQYSLKMKLPGEAETPAAIDKLKKERQLVIRSGSYVNPNSVDFLVSQLKPLERLLYQVFFKEKPANTLLLFTLSRWVNIALNPSKKRSKFLEVEAKEVDSLVQSELSESKVLFDSAKKSRAAANLAQQKRETEERAANRDFQRIAREFRAVVPDEEKNRSVMVRQADLFFSQLKNKEKKVLQIKGALKKAADSVCELYRQNESGFLRWNENFSGIQSKLKYEMKTLVNVIFEAFEYFLNRKNVSPNFIVFLYIYIDFFMTNWNKSEKDPECVSLKIECEDKINFILEFSRSFSSICKPLERYFNDSDKKIESVIRCIAFVSNRMQSSENDFFLKKSDMVNLFKKTEEKLRLLLEKTIDDILFPVESDIALTQAFFVETITLFETMLVKMNEVLVANLKLPPVLSVLYRDPLIRSGFSDLDFLKEHYAHASIKPSC